MPGILACRGTRYDIAISARYVRAQGRTACGMVLGKDAAASNPVRRGIATYLHAAGIQSGYSFFAPNIPGYHKLILELYYDDGHVEYDSPHVSGRAAALRLDSLLDAVGGPSLRTVAGSSGKMLALSVWRSTLT